MSIILHVGAGKCGSSSLQARLSRSPLLGADDGSAGYEYVCITPDGDLLRRDDIDYFARLTPYKAQVSAGAQAPWASDHAALERLSSQLQGIRAQGLTPIASQESWLRQADIFRANEILPRLGLTAKIVVFVRPQVPWMNSAWWQWGAWSGHDLDWWVDANRDAGIWTQHIDVWRTVPGVGEVEVHLAAGDVVLTFLRSLGISIRSAPRQNASLDRNLLDYLRRRGDLRSVHDPAVDFILEQRLATDPKGTPWIMRPERIAELIGYYRPDNLKLLCALPAPERRAMEQDPMWWDPAAYRERQPVPADIPEPTVAALEDVSRRAIDAVIRLDDRVRVLEASQRALKRAVRASAKRRRELNLALAEAKSRQLTPTLRRALGITSLRRLLGAAKARVSSGLLLPAAALGLLPIGHGEALLLGALPL
ncbi:MULTISPECIES: hypothetical protein [Rhodomicrobium]|uniref:hypothetical protein n=1 Tax=Rhodomicrobium TaxID=1068 RepID=UPI000B4AE514|nr:MULTISPECIES: hypothetical protein [Rhodomicrobium]